MNYENHYWTLIGYAQLRESINGYSEKHHVIPRSIGGKDIESNLVRLTPEEHYVAHQLLVRIMPNEPTLIAAAFLMGGRTNKIHGWVRRYWASQKWALGHRHDESTRQRISIGNKGKPKSESHRKNISIASIGRIKSAEHCANISKTAFGRKMPDSMREKARIRMMGNTNTLGYSPSPASRQRMSVAQIGRKHSSETIAKMKIAQQVRRSQERIGSNMS